MMFSEGFAHIDHSGIPLVVLHNMYLPNSAKRNRSKIDKFDKVSAKYCGNRIGTPKMREQLQTPLVSPILGVGQRVMKPKNPAELPLSQGNTEGLSSESAYDEDGVDVSLIRWMLSLTPTERLQALQSFVDLVASATSDRNTH